MTKEQFTKEIKKHFTTNAKLTLTEAKIKIKQQMQINEYNNSIHAAGVKLLYTSNKNYCGGVQNGYGEGFYLSNVGFKGGSEIKL